MAAAVLTEKVSAAGSTQGVSWGDSQGPTGARGGGDAWVLGQGGVGAVESGSAVRARRGLVGRGGYRPGQPREKQTSPANRRPPLSQVLASSAQEEQPLAAAEELSAQKREQRLRKFRELHLKRVSRC